MKALQGFLTALALGCAAAAQAQQHAGHEAHDNDVHSYVLLDRLEAWRGDGATGLGWEAKGWVGTDLTRLWIRSRGERIDGHVDAADLELLYGRSITPWWDVVAGLRQDFAPDGAQTFAAMGIQGLAPQRFEVKATGYFGEGGQSALRLSAERELLLTNRLIAQPLLEVTVFGKDDARRGIGSGPSKLETGLRLRYEFTRRFAPYVGVSYERALGDTAELRRAGGSQAGDVRYVAGLRTWF
jgi:copper resistance protein B